VSSIDPIGDISNDVSNSGGYNLKVGASSIELMKFDMGGCAAVLGTARAIGQLRPKVND
jgi:leucyl aminopeptidase